MNKKYDIIVAGGGLGGTTAAIVAAKQGKRVLLVERNAYLGGLGTGGLVPSFAPFPENGFSYGEVPELIFSEYKKNLFFTPQNQYDWVPIDAEVLKLTLDILTDRFGVDVLFNCEVSGVKLNGSRIEAVKIGDEYYSAKCFVDGTTDAVIASAAGCPFLEKSESQPSSFCFKLGNVNEELYYSEEYIQNNNPKSPIFDIIQDSEFPLITYPHLCVNGIYNGIVGFNAGYIFSGNSLIERSAAIKKGRATAYEYLRALKKYTKAFENAVLIESASMLGIRESVNIEGEELLTVDTYINRTKHEDGVAVNNYFVDLHSAALAAHHIENKTGGVDLYEGYRPGEYYTIPYHSLLPKGIDNLIIGSKNISCDRFMHASIRVMPSVMGIGAAAGNAAAICPDGKFKKVDIKILRNICNKNK